MISPTSIRALGTMLTAPLVPTGTYFVRVRARNARPKPTVHANPSGCQRGCALSWMSGSATLAHCKRRRGLVTLTWLPPLSAARRPTTSKRVRSRVGRIWRASIPAPPQPFSVVRVCRPVSTTYAFARSPQGARPAHVESATLRHHHGQCPDGAGVHNVEVVVRNPSSPWSLTFTASPPGAGGVVPSSFRFLEPPGVPA